MSEQDIYFYGGEDGSFIKTFKENEEKKIRDDIELKSKKEVSIKDKVIQELKDNAEKVNKERSIENERNKKQMRFDFDK